jgi:glycosyltransferase involved in cell wall biosynthesis
MRLTVLTSSYPRFHGDGTAPFVQSLSEHLAKLGHEVEVVAPYDPAVQEFPKSIPVHRFRYTLPNRWHIIGHARSLADDARLRPAVFLMLPFFLLMQLVTGLRVARRQRAEMIHAHWVLPNGLVGALLSRTLRIPLAISLHGSDIFVARRSPIFGRVTGWVLQQAAVVTACSDDLRQGALDLGAKSDNVHLIAWGADPDRFHPSITPADRSRYGLEDDDLVLIALGRIVSKKGFDILVRALPALVQSHPYVQVLIGGDGAQRGQLRHLAEKLSVSDHLHLPGRIDWDHVPHFLAMGDIFVLPSVLDAVGNLDGLPTVLLEALALGKPVVATAIGGIPLVIEDGVNGMLCPSSSTDALGQTINKLIQGDRLRAQLGQAARLSVERHFNWLEVARQFTALFEPAIAGQQDATGKPIPTEQPRSL